MPHRRLTSILVVAVVAALALGSTAAFAAKSASSNASTPAAPPSGGPGQWRSGAPTGTPPTGDFGFKGEHGRGPGGPGGHGIMGAGLIEVVSKLTGESTTTIMTSRQSGRSLATIAKAKGVTVAEIVELASHAPRAALDSQVADDLITRSEADKVLSELKTRWTQELNDTQAGSGGGWGGREGRRGGPPPAGAPTTQPSTGGNSSSQSTTLQ
jgi:hypothetical protein